MMVTVDRADVEAFIDRLDDVKAGANDVLGRPLGLCFGTPDQQVSALYVLADDAMTAGRILIGAIKAWDQARLERAARPAATEA